MLRSVLLTVQKQFFGRFTSVNTAREKERSNNGINVWGGEGWGKKKTQTLK